MSDADAPYVYPDMVVGRDLAGREVRRRLGPAEMPPRFEWALRQAQGERGAAVERILIVHPWGIGDWIMFEPALRSLRAAYPRARFDAFLYQPGTAPFVRTFHGAYLERIVARPRGVLALGAVVADLRRARYDLAIASTGAAPWKVRAFLRAVRPRAAVAEFLRTRAGLSGGARRSRKVHEVEANLMLARAAGGRPVDPVPRLPRPGPEEEAAVDAWLAKAFPEGARRFLCFHPGSARHGAYRRWPLERFEAVVRALAAEGLPAVAVAGPDEPDLAERAAAILGRERVFEARPFRETAALLARAAVALTTDSALGHVAAALGTPTVTIFGPARPARTAPFGPHCSFVWHGDLRCQPCVLILPQGCPERTCLEEVRPEQVTRLVREALARVRD